MLKNENRKKHTCYMTILFKTVNYTIFAGAILFTYLKNTLNYNFSYEVNLMGKSKSPTYI